jgi:hypothetical protein
MGWATFASSTLQNWSPLQVVREVLSKRDSSKIERRLAFASLLSVSIWAFYGFIIGDLFTWLAMVPSFVFTLIQVVLCCLFPRTEEAMFSKVQIVGGGEDSAATVHKVEDKEGGKLEVAFGGAEDVTPRHDNKELEDYSDTESSSESDITVIEVVDLGLPRAFKCFSGEEYWFGAMETWGEGKGKREEGRGKREEERGKRKEGRRGDTDQMKYETNTIYFSLSINDFLSVVFLA